MAVRRSRSTLIVVLLFATLTMTAMLAYEAQQAARSHRATAENVLRDYSTFATWELSRLARQHLLEAMNHRLEPVRTARRRGSMDLALSSNCSSGCGGAPPVISAFTARTADLQFSSAGAPLDSVVQGVLTRAVHAGLRDPENFTCPSLAIVPAGGAFRTVVWTPVLDRANRPTEIIGFVTDGTLVTQAIQKVIKNNPLLPPSLVPVGTNTNSVLSVRVLTPEGGQLFASAHEWSAYEASATLPSMYGTLTLAVALRPAAAGGLVIGGLPRERLPLVVGLLGLTAGLVVVALVQLRREAEISRMRADFVSGVSHELRTPLAQIRMFTETLLLGRVRTEDEGRRSLEIVAREAQRLSQLVENVLLFARSERRRPEITRERAPLAPIVRDVVESFAPLAAARRAKLQADIDPCVMASVDAGALRQILLNLLDNAVKYGPIGQTVRIALRWRDGHAELLVDDEGPGIHSQDAERIWEPFHRIATTHMATGGAGIGLAIVKQLVELHGGRVGVEPAAIGARFVVEIPGAWRESNAPAAVA